MRSRVDAGLLRRLDVVADGVDLTAEGRARQHDVGDGDDEGEDEDRHGGQRRDMSGNGAEERTVGGIGRTHERRCAEAVKAWESRCHRIR